MATHPHMLLAYDATGAVVGTLDYMVARDDQGNVTGLVDFAAHEAAGGEHTDIFVASNATGAKVWPEWLGGAAHDFKVELSGPAGAKHIAALVHKASGHRRERAVLETAIADRIQAAQGGPADIRDLVGGPDRPIALDEQGRTSPRVVASRPQLPLASIGTSVPE